jgi:hypothetical protein
MKITLALLRFPAVLAALASLLIASPAAAAPKAASKPADLQVIVDVPPTWRPFLDDDIAEALFYRLRNVFKKRGYTGEIVQLSSGDKENREIPTLRLNLTEWRLDRTGNAQCTMTASVTTPAGEKGLGLATGTALFWPASSGGRWSLNRRIETADALEDAADSAMREVYEAVAKSGLVAGIATKR